MPDVNVPLIGSVPRPVAYGTVIIGVAAGGYLWYRNKQKKLASSAESQAYGYGQTAAYAYGYGQPTLPYAYGAYTYAPYGYGTYGTYGYGNSGSGNGSGTYFGYGQYPPPPSTPQPGQSTKVTVPNVVGMSQADAYRLLADEGLHASGPAPVKGKVHTVTSQAPKAETVVNKGSTVTLTSKLS